MRFSVAVIIGTLPFQAANAGDRGGSVDFNRDVRPILSNHCFQCHGPDPGERKGGLRLDTEKGALTDLGGYRAIVPGDPAKSELMRRVSAEDPADRMPPSGTGKRLSAAEVETLSAWIRQGAAYARHWSYVRPGRVEPPAVADRSWPRNEIDRFVMARLESEGLTPTAEADPYTLVRRVSLALTGLPPRPEEAARFVEDREPGAYERLVDRLLASDAFGEHWARMWLDLARYADSAGYADDPPRTIWAFRDWVIRSLNANKPFDEFTIEQLAGDLLPDPSEDQLIATAFHRNTLTNNEGGTNDEEFRNVAIVDRVNTTMGVWMGTTMACAQCHSHKYDPITQEDYFRFFAIFNNTADADRRDESPVLPLFTEEQKARRQTWTARVSELRGKLSTPTPSLLEGQRRWEERLGEEPVWQALRPGQIRSRAGARVSLLEDGSILVAPGADTATTTVDVVAGEEDLPEIAAIRLETLPHHTLPGGGPGHAGGNFVVSDVRATLTPPAEDRVRGRFVRIEIPGREKILSLAEVEIFGRGENLASNGAARQSSTAYGGPAELAIDGNTDGRFSEARSTTHTEISADPWWEVDLGGNLPIDRIVVWNRTDNGLQGRLRDFRLVVLDGDRRPLWETTEATPPDPRAEYRPPGARALELTAAYADYSQPSFGASRVIDGSGGRNGGWAIGGQVGRRHELVLAPAEPVAFAAGTRLTVEIGQDSSHVGHTLGRFRLAMTADRTVAERARLAARVREILETPAGRRSDAERRELTAHYLAEVAPELESERVELRELRKRLVDMKPGTTVPILRALPPERRRETHIQRRGSFLDLGKEVTQGLPIAFHEPPADRPVDRLALARWLVDRRNPLTARVLANRFWEQVFGVGIVRTSEDFGSQGEPPSHPRLLDWLAVELVDSGWDMKAFLRALVASATYRQSSRVTPDLLARDPDNRLLARGPRFRMTAEMVRDQALFVSGLLSPKMYGPPVRPPQPTLGVSAAFGGGIDWKTSQGEDRYRRAIYTTWRRSNPYPSMATFDAPNREVCTIRRARTNTPLQALVTLNDPVYVEAAQALARRVVVEGNTPRERARRGVLRCLVRPPSAEEIDRLVELYRAAHGRLSDRIEDARRLATNPLGPVPEGTDIVELAAWTAVANVLLNLDETLMAP